MAILIRFFVIISILYGNIAYSADPPLPTPIGRVVWIKGVLTALMPSKEERKLQRRSVIYLNDTLITDDKSQAQIVFTDNTLMTFKESTKFSLEKYNYKGNAKTDGTVMQLVEGGFRTITGVIAKQNPDNYQVNTPVATIGVRGTDYSVFAYKDKTLMGFKTGKPCIQNAQGSLCLSEKQRYAAVNKGSAPVVLNTVPPELQTELEIVPAKISPFAGRGGSRNNRKGNPNSFCISY